MTRDTPSATASAPRARSHPRTSRRTASMDRGLSPAPSRTLDPLPHALGGLLPSFSVAPSDVPSSSLVAGLPAHHHTVAERVVEEEGAKREHLVVYLSGAHAYGFP